MITKEETKIKWILITKEFEHLVDQRGFLTQEVMIFMGIKPDKAVYEWSTLMATKQQGCNNGRNFEYNNNATHTSIYDNDNNNQQINKDSRIVKQNIDTFSINQDLPRNANPPNRNNTILQYFIKIFGDYITKLMRCNTLGQLNFLIYYVSQNTIYVTMK